MGFLLVEKEKKEKEQRNKKQLNYFFSKQGKGKENDRTSKTKGLGLQTLKQVCIHACALEGFTAMFRNL